MKKTPHAFLLTTIKISFTLLLLLNATSMLLGQVKSKGAAVGKGTIQQPTSPATSTNRDVPKEPHSGQKEQPLYGNNRGSIFIKKPELIYLNLDPQSINPRVNDYFKVFNHNSAKAVIKLAQLSLYPEGINTPQKFLDRAEDIKKYKGYSLFKYYDETLKAMVCLYWFPRSDNTHMPKDMLPAAVTGLYMVGQENALLPRPTGKKMLPTQPQLAVSGHKKDPPVALNNFIYALLYNLDAAGLQRARTAFVESGQFTDEEWLKIVSKTNIRNYPTAINTVHKIDRKADMYKNAKSYIQGSFLLPFNGVAQIVDLVWIPKEENSSLPAEYLAPDGGDIYFFVADYYVENKLGYSMSNLHSMPDSFVVAMKAKHKKLAVESPSYEPVYISNYQHLYKPLRALGYTEDEYVRIVELSSKFYVPEGLEYDYYELNEKQFKNYKAYRITDFTDAFGQVRLYWIPKEENMHMPPDLQPTSDEGLFFFNRLSRTEENKALSTQTYTNKPDWQIYPELYKYYANGGTDAETAEYGKRRRAEALARMTQNQTKTNYKEENISITASSTTHTTAATVKCSYCSGRGQVTLNTTSYQQLTPNVYQSHSSGTATLVSQGQSRKISGTTQATCPVCNGSGTRPKR